MKDGFVYHSQKLKHPIKLECIDNFELFRMYRLSHYNFHDLISKFHFNGYNCLEEFLRKQQESESLFKKRSIINQNYLYVQQYADEETIGDKIIGYRDSVLKSAQHQPALQSWTLLDCWSFLNKPGQSKRALLGAAAQLINDYKIKLIKTKRYHRYEQRMIQQ